MNRWTLHGRSQPTSLCGLKRVEPGLTEVWLSRLSDCIHACACASSIVLCVVKKWREDSYKGTPWRLGHSQCVRASLRFSSPGFLGPSRVLPMHIWQSFGSLWWIVSAMASNSGSSSSSNAISRSDRHMALIMNNELPWTKPGSTAFLADVRVDANNPVLSEFDLVWIGTVFNLVCSADTP